MEDDKKTRGIQAHTQQGDLTNFLTKSKGDEQKNIKVIS
jgi:hypothetical protein